MKKKQLSQLEHELGRGQINDNALKAAVTSPLFKTRTEKPKKGKGSYNRKGHKLKGYAPFDFRALLNAIVQQLAGLIPHH